MAVERVTRTLNGETKELEYQGGIIYRGNAEAPKNQLKTSESISHYPVTVIAEDESGNQTVERRDLEVHNNIIFPMELIVSDAKGEEIAYINEDMKLDLDIGDTNDFEMAMSLSEWKKEKYDYGYRIYAPGTEYGGLLEDMRVLTASNRIEWYGDTWRGLLRKKIVEPPEGQEHLVLNGELNDVIRELAAEQFDSLFFVDEVDTGVMAQNWMVDRYVSLYDAIMKLLAAHGHRLQIEYIKPDGVGYGAVHLRAVPVKDYSDQIEYSQDYDINFDIRDSRRGINHLVCVGKGEGEERIVLHLYVQEDGSIGTLPYYTGLSERAAVYDYSSAEAEKLEEDGKKRLKELQNYKSIELTVDDIDLEIGDIIGGRETVTDMELKKPVVGKILAIKGGIVEIRYKVKGDD